MKYNYKINSKRKLHDGFFKLHEINFRSTQAGYDQIGTVVASIQARNEYWTGTSHASTSLHFQTGNQSAQNQDRMSIRQTVILHLET